MWGGMTMYSASVSGKRKSPTAPLKADCHGLRDYPQTRHTALISRIIPNVLLRPIPPEFLQARIHSTALGS